jgi:hypothetical protein
MEVVNQTKYALVEDGIISKKDDKKESEEKLREKDKSDKESTETLQSEIELMKKSLETSKEAIDDWYAPKFFGVGGPEEKTTDNKSNKENKENSSNADKMTLKTKAQKSSLATVFYENSVIFHRKFAEQMRTCFRYVNIPMVEDTTSIGSSLIWRLFIS